MNELMKSEQETCPDGISEREINLCLGRDFGCSAGTPAMASTSKIDAGNYYYLLPLLHFLRMYSAPTYSPHS
jgi:hypothetical protein